MLLSWFTEELDSIRKRVLCGDKIVLHWVLPLSIKACPSFDLFFVVVVLVCFFVCLFVSFLLHLTTVQAGQELTLIQKGLDHMILLCLSSAGLQPWTTTCAGLILLLTWSGQTQFLIEGNLQTD